MSEFKVALKFFFGAKGVLRVTEGNETLSLCILIRDLPIQKRLNDKAAYSAGGIHYGCGDHTRSL